MKEGASLRKRLFAVLLLVAFVMGTVLVPVSTAEESRAAFDWESGITVTGIGIDATPDELTPTSYKTDLSKVTVDVANTGEIYLKNINVELVVYKWNGSGYELNFTYNGNGTSYLDLAGNGDDAMFFEFREGEWANGSLGTWVPQLGKQYKVVANATAMDVELGNIWDETFEVFKFALTTDIGFDESGADVEEWGGDGEVWFGVNEEVWFRNDLAPLTVYNDTCFLVPAGGNLNLTVTLSSFGSLDPAGTTNVMVGYRIWTNDTTAWSVEQDWVLKEGPWNQPFYFDGAGEGWSTWAVDTMYSVEVQLFNWTDGNDANNRTNRSLYFCSGLLDMTPTIDNLQDGASYPKAAMTLDYTIWNVGFFDLTNPDNVAVNITYKKDGTHNSEVYFHKALKDTTGGAELVGGHTTGSAPGWNPDTTGWYVVNITTGWMDAANEDDDKDENNVTSYLVQIVNPAKSIEVVIDTPATGEYPHDYGLSVNTTVTNTGDVGTAAAGGDINVSLAMYAHGEDEPVYEGMMSLGDHLAAGAFNDTVIFDIPDTVYEINEDYDIMVWVNVTNGTGHSQYSNAGDFINVTFYYPPDGTISGTVAGAPAGYSVWATDGVETYYATTGAGGVFDFDPQTFDWNVKWDVGFEGRYMYFDDEVLDVEVVSEEDSVVDLTAVLKPKAKVTGTLTIGGAHALNVTRDVTIRDIADAYGDSEGVLAWNATEGVWKWTMWVYDDAFPVNHTANITAQVPEFAKYFETAWKVAKVYQYVNESSMMTTNVSLMLTYDPLLAVTYTSMDGDEVEVDSNIRAVFDEAIDPTTINASTFKVAGTGVPAYNATHFSISGDNMTVTLNLPADLAEGEDYTVTLTEGILINNTDKAYLPWDHAEAFTTVMAGGYVTGTVTDLDGGAGVPEVMVHASGVEVMTDEFGEYMLPLPAGDHEVMAAKEGWTVVDGPDANVNVVAGNTTVDVDFVMAYAPYDVNGASIAPGAIDVPLDASIVIPFLVAMDTTTFTDVTVTLTYDDGARAALMHPGNMSWSPDNMTLTYDPLDDLMEGTLYTFTISRDVKDSHNMSFEKDIVITFTTVSTPPPARYLEVTTTTPMNNATDVALDTPVTVSFNYAVNTTQVEGLISAVGGAITNFTWNAANNSVTLVMDLECGTTYTVTLAMGATSAVMDVLPMAAAHSFSFTTIDCSPTTISVTFGPFAPSTAVTLKIGDNTLDGTTDAEGMVTFEIPLDWLDDAATFTLTVGDDVYEGNVADLTEGNIISPDDMTLVEEEEDKKDEDEGDDMMIYALVLVVVVVLILLLVFARGKKEEEMPMDEDMDEEKGEFECPSCGAMVSGDVGECPECGEVFEEDQFRCPECGAEVEPGMDECPECGEVMEVPAKEDAMEGDEFPEDEEMTDDLEAEGDEGFEVEAEEEPMEAFDDEGSEEDDFDDDDDFDDEDEGDELDLDEDEEKD